MELIHKLGIDWKLLLAQIVNFFILLLVLYKFAYKPILAMLEKRERTIAKGIADAKAAEEKLAEISRLKEEKMKETAAEIGKLLSQAKQDAEAMKQDIMKTATQQADDLLKRTKLQLAEEKEKMIHEVKAEVAEFVVAATQKILQREFSVTDQKKFAEEISQSMSP